MKIQPKLIAAATLPAFLALASNAHACAACFGKSDSNMAKGMNAGIFALLAVIGTVMVGAASFFVFLARKAATTPRDGESVTQPRLPQP